MLKEIFLEWLLLKQDLKELFESRVSVDDVTLFWINELRTPFKETSPASICLFKVHCLFKVKNGKTE